MIRSRILLPFSFMCLAACTPATKMLAPAHPAINPSEVTVYPAPPANAQPIAELTATKKSVFTPGGPKAEDVVIERLKELAAKVGANGIILETFDDRVSGSIGTGVGSTSYSGNSAVGVGVSGGVGIFKKTGHARAVFVPSP
jgi:hypothetical protein